MPADTVFSLILGPIPNAFRIGASEVNSVFDSIQIRSNTISAVRFVNVKYSNEIAVLQYFHVFRKTQSVKRKEPPETHCGQGVSPRIKDYDSGTGISQFCIQ